MWLLNVEFFFFTAKRFSNRSAFLIKLVKFYIISTGTTIFEVSNQQI